MIPSVPFVKVGFASFVLFASLIAVKIVSFSLSFIFVGFKTFTRGGYVGLAETIFTVTSFLFIAFVALPALSLAFNFIVMPEKSVVVFPAFNPTVNLAVASAAFP